MCGIAGIVDCQTPPTEALLQRMSAPLARRGPDDSGTFLRGALGLAHRRLSIIDLAGGHQPMFNEDRSLALVFNGEIYDHAVLRERLKHKGHHFMTDCDSEVLLHLFEEKGESMVKELNGMFAFAICDVQSQRLFLARDRLGQKPLFYAENAERFAFASGPASLSFIEWVDSSLDLTAIHHYLELQYIPTPLTIHRGICKLPPGHSGIWEGGRFKTQCYWSPRVRGDYAGSYNDAMAECRERLSASVKRRLVADVPLGIYLSGGMDSSLICALAKQHSTTPPQTFSIGFPARKYDERAFSEQVARHLGTEHHFLEVVPSDFARLTECVDRFEEPFCDASMLPTALLSDFTRRHVTVALSGDAADELFGGYYRYRVMQLGESFQLIPASLRGTLGKMLLAGLPAKKVERSLVGKLRRLAELCPLDGLPRYMRLISRCHGDFKTALYTDAMREACSAQDTLEILTRQAPGSERVGSMIDEVMEVDLKTYLNDDILVKVDRASMAYGLEVRSPFLDPGVVDLALSLPSVFKQKGCRRKRILADAFTDLLPAEIFERRKMGFGVPVSQWLRKEWREPVSDLFSSSRLVTEGLFRPDRLHTLLDEHLAGRGDHSYPIFALVVLELWLRRGMYNSAW